MTPARDWMTMPQDPLDLVLVPSAMSHATSMGLGLALAQPDRRVIVCNGDGSMLMNLGSLVSIAEARASNLSVLVFDNGTYEVTGSQRVPGAGSVNFVQLADGAGFRAAFQFSDIATWRRGARNALFAPGPTFIWLARRAGGRLPGPKSPGPAGERANTFMAALRKPERRHSVPENGVRHHFGLPATVEPLDFKNGV